MFHWDGRRQVRFSLGKCQASAYVIATLAGCSGQWTAVCPKPAGSYRPGVVTQGKTSLSGRIELEVFDARRGTQLTTFRVRIDDRTDLRPDSTGRVRTGTLAPGIVRFRLVALGYRSIRDSTTVTGAGGVRIRASMEPEWVCLDEISPGATPSPEPPLIPPPIR